MVSRRMVLGAGLGGLALVGAGGVWRVTRAPETAYGPWDLAAASAPDDIRLDAFRHAILAPNPHNRQPWVIRLIGEDAAEISCDLDKRLPVTDPFDRQITIGFGTFLEVARIAALERGYAMETELFPDGEAQPRLDESPVARVTFAKVEGAERDHLFSAIPQRRSNKEVYDLTKKVRDIQLETITLDGGSFSADPAFVAQLRSQILKAIEIEMTTPGPYMESVDLMRIGHDQIDANPDGIDLSGPMVEAGIVAGQIDRDQLADMSSQAYAIGLEQTREAYGSVASLIWITTPGNSRADQIEAGRQYVRANLQATQLGLAMHPMSQSLQEYAEVAVAYRDVHKLLGAKEDERVQMLARVGYGKAIGPSPRWPLESHMI
ncbi:Acg family FMN-binding oxidoreductase [Parasphingorhabdus sp.]|uniref:Acg family FMN-binding oxidoreductase n=1 Tax=Parasphingorhabdus sp. TaxID=2709688 RepID=UPI003D2700F5